jgi:hypothetical protein
VTFCSKPSSNTRRIPAMAKITDITIRRGSLMGFLTFAVHTDVVSDSTKKKIVTNFSRKEDVISFLDLMLDKKEITEDELMEAMNFMRDPEKIRKPRKEREDIVSHATIEGEDEGKTAPPKWNRRTREQHCLLMCTSSKCTINQVWEQAKKEGDTATRSGYSQILNNLVKKNKMRFIKNEEKSSRGRMVKLNHYATILKTAFEE